MPRRIEAMRLFGSRELFWAVVSVSPYLFLAIWTWVRGRLDKRHAQSADTPRP